MSPASGSLEASVAGSTSTISSPKTRRIHGRSEAVNGAACATPIASEILCDVVGPLSDGCHPPVAAILRPAPDTDCCSFRVSLDKPSDGLESMDLKERSASSSVVALLLLLPGETRALEQQSNNEKHNSIVVPGMTMRKWLQA
ncbi:hypothetical protein E2562_014318 [Oryza meyeriana var. granulata]|uniref:Uncharacterized protein n=1 Tax=Oryza meyeriana var. granulata TaxID=110450 RepID=A0A6G1C622_9ORYZ|nr:hypothetical protein E2562_014318 [Oryza meyeriana var. granulata]